MESLPASLTWGEYIRQWTEDRSGWTQLANELVDRAAASTDVPDDAQRREPSSRFFCQHNTPLASSTSNFAVGEM